MTVEAVHHAALTAPDMERVRGLFDDEYRSNLGPWNPDQPYGYAPHDVHVVARHGEDAVGHVGWARRVIDVGGAEVVIAGVGGVLVSCSWRGRRLGERLMSAAAQSMQAAQDIDFGYLGCHEGVVPFYTACGWRRITAVEHFIGRDGAPAVEEAEAPLLVLPIRRPVEEWPGGEIDLRGRAW
ncbi:GNAT family N-acetyltransferase [Nesterenkonia sp. F]|uniref:GNAT family N-acetyltransferase n=1 Tax=Nesterenkonia sp. F TaxID=795955 RepID=UPI001ED90813|nr:GNAT family N-acetyltransferase [Nesterenkonia sp. F]